MQTSPAILKTNPDISADARFDRLVDELLEPLFGYVRRLVVVREDAEDVVQQTFLRAYEGFASFRGGDEQLRAWCYRIATNTAISLLRRRRIRRFTSDASLALCVAAESVPDADAALQRMQRAVLELPLRQRLVFNLRYYDEMPYARIAEVLGLREPTLRTAYHAAVGKLKKKLSEP